MRGPLPGAVMTPKPLIGVPARRRRDRAAAVAAALLGLASTAASCPGARSTVDLLNRATLYGSDAATAIKPSDVFCGNWAKRSRQEVCRSKAEDGSGQRPAFEHVEVRGWVLQPGGWADNNHEYVFDLLLDHGWTPASPSAERVRPINTAAELNAAVTPHNQIQFGTGADRRTGSAMLDRDGKVWGGPGSMVLHVEVNGWGPDRLRAGPPADWKRHPELADLPIGWPFDPKNPPATRPGPLQSGDYVRLVGTLWEDEPHDCGNCWNGPEGDKGEDAKGCWNSGATGQNLGRGYFEIHPVDYMARLDPPPAPAETVEMLSLCGTSSITREIRPPGPPPTPQSRIGFDEIADNGFTVWRSVRTPNRVTVLPDRIRVDVAVERGGFLGLGHGAKFKAVYRVFWQ